MQRFVFLIGFVHTATGAFLINFDRNPYSARKWETTNIKYRLSASLYPNETIAIRDALAQFEDLTCLRFIEDPWLEYGGIIFFRSPKEKCRGTVGRQPRNVIYGYWRCWSKPGYILHEVMHNLGFRHEHQRPDVDEHVTIIRENIQEENFHFFAPVDPSYHDTYGTEYDPYSVMHYEPTLFAKPHVNVTMTPNNKDIIADLIGQKRWLSRGDITTINKIYCSEGNNK